MRNYAVRGIQLPDDIELLMGAEDILYAAWHRGIRNKVLEKLSDYDHAIMEQKDKTEKAYKHLGKDFGWVQGGLF